MSKTVAQKIRDYLKDKIGTNSNQSAIYQSWLDPTRAQCDKEDRSKWVSAHTYTGIEETEAYSFTPNMTNATKFMIRVSYR